MWLYGAGGTGKSMFIPFLSPMETSRQPVPTSLSLDKMSLQTDPHLNAPTMAVPSQGHNIAVFQNRDIMVAYDLSTGMADFYTGGQMILDDFHSLVKLPHGVTSRDYTSRTVQKNGHRYTISLQGDNLPEMTQCFDLSSGNYLIVSFEMAGTNLSSGYMAPVVMEGRGLDLHADPTAPAGLDLAAEQDTESIHPLYSREARISAPDMRALWVPFDNDRFARYDASSINREDTSYEVAAFYDNASRKGLIIGSVTHDTWKTGIRFKGSHDSLDYLEAAGGVTINNGEHHGTMNRDVQQHGRVSGSRISSPKIFVGYFDDWRHGLETYAEANAHRVPRREWKAGVPFGWNSWGGVGDKLDTQKVMAASNHIASMMKRGFENDQTAYINLDSYWDNSTLDLERVVEAVHLNGQKAGIYWAPFVDWAKDPYRGVEGTDYKYQDVWLKDDKGQPITYGDGPYALDPTHPGTRGRMDYFIGLFKSKGFDEYIKIDFLTHAALEGRHYDTRVTTGMQAIHAGLKYLTEALESQMGTDVFISSAISPLFPYEYAHSRRISCDVFGYLSETRGLMNSLAYGWWMNGRIYTFNDPDHMVLYDVWWDDNPALSENEAKTRVTSAITAGTVFLSGDDLTDPHACLRAEKYLTNDNINHIARLGKAFRPVEGNTGEDAPDLFVLNNGQDGFYLAVFNWDTDRAATKTIHLERAGLDPALEYTAIEQWSDTTTLVSGTLFITLDPAEARVYLLK